MHHPLAHILACGLMVVGIGAAGPLSAQTPIKTAARAGVSVRAQGFDTLTAVSAGEAVTGTATSSSSAARITFGILPLQRQLPTHVDETPAAVSPSAIAPNPANAACRLTLPAASTSRTVTIVDGEGRRHHTAVVERGTTIVDLPTANLPSGSYTVVSSDGRTSWSTRLVVVH